MAQDSTILKKDRILLNPEHVERELLKVEKYYIPIDRIISEKNELGHGGFGIVKRAILLPPDSGTGTSVTVVVKELKIDDHRVIPLRAAYRLVREMAVWAKCEHENILQFIGFHLGENYDPAYLISPYMKNGNVSEYLKKNQIDSGGRLRLVRDTLDGLEYLHTRNPAIVHGDLKAANVIVNDDQRAQLCDFGLSRAIQQDRTGVTTSTEFSGTVKWCSPEILNSKKPKRTCASDVWSWGCLVLEIMTDKIPYSDQETSNQVVIAMWRDNKTPEPQPMPNLPGGLPELLRECWKFEYDQRPNVQSCQCMLDDVTLTANPPSNSRNLLIGETSLVDSESIGETGPEVFLSNMSRNPNVEIDSIVGPGYRFDDNQLPPKIPGAFEVPEEKLSIREISPVDSEVGSGTYFGYRATSFVWFVLIRICKMVLPSSMSRNPSIEIDSIVGPGYRFDDNQLPPKIPGTFEIPEEKLSVGETSPVDSEVFPSNTSRNPSIEIDSSVGPGNRFNDNRLPPELPEAFEVPEEKFSIGEIRFIDLKGPSNISHDENAENDSVVPPGHRVDELPSELPGTFEILGKALASRAFYDMFQGKWLRPGKPPMTVAIKRVKLHGYIIPKAQFQTAEQRIKREIMIWAIPKHPNILPFIGCQIDSRGAPLLVSPWCQNGNLASYTKARPNLPRAERVRLLHGAACGLAYLHTLIPPIVHGDIKPENIIIQDNLEPGLCDFGISKIVAAVGQRAGLTTSGDIFGTNGFQAAEILNDGPATTASDVFAFGGIILVAMSGKAPFESHASVMALIAVTTGKTPARNDHPRLPATDPLWYLLEACMALKPDTRPDMPTVQSKLLSIR